MNDAGAAPSVSVLLCIHNGERFLSATLDSLFAQNFSNFELIAVDDSSSDHSLDFRSSRTTATRAFE